MHKDVNILYVKNRKQQYEAVNYLRNAELLYRLPARPGHRPEQRMSGPGKGKGVKRVVGKIYEVQRKQLCRDLIEFLRTRELNYGQALITLKDAQSYVERASLKNQL